MDDVIRMCTEVGVNEFVPFESEYSVVRLKDLTDKKISKKMLRWGKIAKEATRQSERAQIPLISPPTTFENILKINTDHKLLLHSRKKDTEKTVATYEEALKKFPENVRLTYFYASEIFYQKMENLYEKGLELNEKIKTLDPE